jgi:hypothetical protein
LVFERRLTCRLNGVPRSEEAMLNRKGHGVLVHLELAKLTLDIRGADPILRPWLLGKNLVEDLGESTELDLLIREEPPTEVGLVSFHVGGLDEGLAITLGQLASLRVVFPVLDDMHELGVEDVIKVLGDRR